MSDTNAVAEKQPGLDLDELQVDVELFLALLKNREPDSTNWKWLVNRVLDHLNEQLSGDYIEVDRIV